MQISVLIRSYNAQSTIKHAVESALSQNFPKQNFEVIIVDDGSQDKTREILETYKGHPNIRVIYGEHQGGLAAARRALTEARGGYVIMLDSDDYFMPQTLARLSGALDEQPEIAYAYCDYYEEFEGGKRHVKLKSIFETVACDIMFRRKELIAVGFWRDGFNFPEYDLLLRTLDTWKGVHVKEPLFVYCRRSKSATADPAFVEKGIAELQTAHPDRLKEIGRIRSYALI